MTFAIIVAVIMQMHPQKGMRQFPVVFEMAHGKHFLTMEDCRRWMRKTGDDSAEQWETAVDSQPHLVVIKYSTKCAIPGKEV